MTFFGFEKLRNARATGDIGKKVVNGTWTWLLFLDLPKHRLAEREKARTQRY